MIHQKAPRFKEDEGTTTNINYTRLPEKGVVFISADEYAHRVGITGNSVRVRCRKGDIPGARKEGKLWRIPVMKEGRSC